LEVTQPNYGFTGGCEYAKTVFYKLAEKLTSNYILEVFYNPEKKLDPKVFAVAKEHNFVVHYCKDNTHIASLLKNNTYDVFYSAIPYGYYDIEIPPKTKFILTLHGLRDLEYYDDEYESIYEKRSILSKIKKTILRFSPMSLALYHKKNKREIYCQKTINSFSSFFARENNVIITVSYHSLYAINYFFPNVELAKINVIYSPPLKETIPPSCQVNDEKILTDLRLSAGKYILLICGDRPEKGALRACNAIQKLFELHNNNPILRDLQIIVLGVVNKEIYKKITNRQVRFTFIDYVESSVLEVLYKNAHLFMFPTLNEGFGYPPLEAMKYGTLCACSANSAITEVCADSVLYFNPYDDIEIGVRILQSFDKDIRNEKVKKMKERLVFINERQGNDLERIAEIILN
jgi:hypothetical protein